MSSNPGQTTTLWSEILLRSVAELRESHDQLPDDLNAEAVQDFSRLFEATRRMEALIASAPGAPNSDDHSHDLMNALAAVQGYAEMLQEDLGDRFESLNDTFSRLLTAVRTASSVDTAEPVAVEFRSFQGNPLVFNTAALAREGRRAGATDRTHEINTFLFQGRHIDITVEIRIGDHHIAAAKDGHHLAEKA